MKPQSEYTKENTIVLIPFVYNMNKMIVYLWDPWVNCQLGIELKCQGHTPQQTCRFNYLALQISLRNCSSSSKTC